LKNCFLTDRETRKKLKSFTALRNWNACPIYTIFVSKHFPVEISSSATKTFSVEKLAKSSTNLGKSVAACDGSMLMERSVEVLCFLCLIL